jgi:WD40 repeat protein/serine/threonine protein kinase
MKPTETAPGSAERQLFFSALEKPAGKDRAAFIDGACMGNSTLRRRLEALLQQFEALGTFLEEPAVSAADALSQPPAPVFLKETADMATANEKPGDRIGRYKLLQQIGEGGCGVVYMAEQEEPVRRRVALKVIRLGMDTKNVIARFEAERQALALMDHPNIAKVLDAGATETGRPYFVMELVRGIKITEYCDRNNLPTRQRLELFIQICRAIQHAHQKGIIHRDIKPSNILVTIHDGIPLPKVIDFGIAKATTDQRLTDKTLFTQFEQFIGTPAYMSPEQAEMGGLDIDTRSDVYSLGVLLYELLTGKTPFDSKDLLALGLDEMRRTIREKEPVRPSTRLGTMLEGELTTAAKRRACQAPHLIHIVRGDLDWIVMKCLEKDRTRRYETANGLAFDLQRHLQSEPVTARPPSRLYQIQKLARRNKLAFAAAFAVAAALVCGIVASAWQAARATRAREEAASNARAARQAQAQESAARAEAQQLLYVSDMDLAHLALEEGNLRRAETLLEAHNHKPGEEDLRGFEWHALKRLCRGDQLFSFPPQAYVPLCVAFSPDGRLLATGNGNRPLQGVNSPAAASRLGELKLFDLATKREVITFPRQVAWITSIAFARDNQTIAAGRSDGKITLWNVSGQKVADLPTSSLESIIALSFSPNGQVLASGNSDGTLTLWNTESRRQGWTTQFGDPISTLAFAPDGSRLAVARGRITFVEISTTNRLDVPWPATEIGSLAFSPNGKTLAVGNVNTWVRLLDLGSLSTNALKVTNLGQHQSMVSSVAFFPDGKLVSASYDHTLKLWDVGRLKEISVLKGHRGAISQVAVSPDGTTVASVGDDMTIRLWSREPVPETDVLKHPAWVNSADFSRDGKWLVTGCRDPDGTIRLWDVASGQCIRTVSGHTGGVFRVLFSKDNKFVISGGNDETIKIWDAINPREEPLAILRGHHGSVFCLCLSPDGRTLVSANGNWGETNPGLVKLWAFPKGDEIASFLAHTNGIHCMAISPDGRLLVTGSWDTTIKLWDLGSRKPLAELNAHSDPVTAVAFSPDGKTLVSGCEAGKLIFWNVATRQELQTVEEVAGLDGLVFSGDGRTLVETYVNTVRLRNVVTQKELLTLHGHEAFVFTPVISPDGRILATPSSDRTVRLWPAARFFQD